MKSQNQSGKPVNLKFLMILLVITGSVIIVASCGENKNSVTNSTEIAPPPPPPPPVADADTAFTQVDELPVYKDGEKGLLDYFKNNTVYPEDARKNKITGRVLVKFIVEKDGSVSNTRILKSVSPSLDAEAVRVISSLPKFEKPGKTKGEIVRVNFIIPITFNLN
jgi:periplasmic protein TonB